MTEQLEQAPPAPAPARRFASLRAELSNPLFRNAYALMINGGLTGVLGLGFWAVATRFYPQDVIGRNAAEIQAVMFIGGLTVLNYMLMRFIPQAGRSTASLVLRTYALGAGAAVVLGFGFLLTLDRWGPNYAHLGGWGPGLLFLAFIVGWNIFTQQDGAFTGLRSAGWVPVKNTGFGLAKFALLGLSLFLMPVNGIVLATMIPVIIALVPGDLLIFKRLIPEHVRRTDGMHRTPTTREIGRYLAGDYVGTMFSHAAFNFIPVIVATLISSTANAHFAMAWVLGIMLEIFALNMAMSLTVEGAFDTRRLAETCRAALRRSIMLLVPVTLLTVLFAPLALRVLFGPDYAAQGGPLLQVLALATLPKALIELYIGVLRVQSRTHLVAMLQGVRFVGVLVLILVFVDSAHLVAAGWSVLAVQSAVAVAVLPALLRAARIPPSAVDAARGMS